MIYAVRNASTRVEINCLSDWWKWQSAIEPTAVVRAVHTETHCWYFKTRGECIYLPFVFFHRKDSSSRCKNCCSLHETLSFQTNPSHIYFSIGNNWLIQWQTIIIIVLPTMQKINAYILSSRLKMNDFKHVAGTNSMPAIHMWFSVTFKTDRHAECGNFVALVIIANVTGKRGQRDSTREGKKTMHRA